MSPNKPFEMEDCVMPDGRDRQDPRRYDMKCQRDGRSNNLRISENIVLSLCSGLYKENLVDKIVELVSKGSKVQGFVAETDNNQKILQDENEG